MRKEENKKLVLDKLWFGTTAFQQMAERIPWLVSEKAMKVDKILNFCISSKLETHRNARATNNTV